MKASLLPHVLDSFARLRDEADIVLVEGAGSASEINLRRDDIANMGFARASGTPVVLIGDIDRGGVIASLVGTQAVLDPQDAALIRGFIVNRMRGDASLFADGMVAIAARTGWDALGLVPFLDVVRRLPAEDAADLAAWTDARHPGAKLRIAVPMLPCIANFDDLDPLRAEPGVDLTLVPRGTPLPRSADVVILPGSKATIADLASLRAEGWDIDIAAHVRAGGRVVGLCGGYQMLGRTIADPDGIEGPPGKVEGLGLLDVETVLIGDKRLAAVQGRFCGAPIRRLRNAYRPHHGSGHRQPDAGVRRCAARRGGVGRRQDRRHVRAWAVHGGCRARGMAGDYGSRQPRRARTTPRSRPRSIRWPSTSKNMSTWTACSVLRDERLCRERQHDCQRELDAARNLVQP